LLSFGLLSIFTRALLVGNLDEDDSDELDYFFFFYFFCFLSDLPIEESDDEDDSDFLVVYELKLQPSFLALSYLS